MVVVSLSLEHLKGASMRWSGYDPRGIVRRHPNQRFEFATREEDTMAEKETVPGKGCKALEII